MDKSRFSFKTTLHATIVACLMAGLTCWYSAEILTPNFATKSIYLGVEIRSVNMPGVRISDYALRSEDGSFLLAEGAPKASAIKLEFMHAGRYEVAVKGHYPGWACQANELDKSRFQLRGGTANAALVLKANQVQTVQFDIAKGQMLTPLITGGLTPKCARAELSFSKLSSLAPYFLGFCILWLTILGLALAARASPNIALIGISFNVLLNAANGSLTPLHLENLAVDLGLSLCVVSILFLVALLRTRSPWLALAVSLPVTAAVTACALICVAVIAYQQVFGVAISVEAIHGLMQSYDAQMVEFWQQYIGYRRTLFAILGVAIIALMVTHISWLKSNSAVCFLLAVLFAISGMMMLLGRADQSAMYTLFTKSAIIYKWEIEAFEKVAKGRKASTAQAVRSAKHSQDSTVIVIGESVNKKHMSLYGYVQPTTPRLVSREENGELLAFQNAYSNHTHSNPTMALMLTEANQYNAKAWLESASVFNYASAAAIKTHWLTNHRLLGGWSNQITTIAREADQVDTINYKIGYGLDSTHYDEDLLPLLDKSLSSDPYQLKFLHLYSNHSLYCQRFPDSLEEFKSDLPATHFRNLSQLKKATMWAINCYDTSILYTDQVLDKIISRLEQNENPTVMLYVADHAEEVIDDRTHNSALFTYDMINIPLIVWANEAWKKKHPEVWHNIEQNKSKVWTNDLLFEAVLGLAGVESTSLDASKNITSENYQQPASPLTLHGRVKVDAEQNWNFWQTNNSLYAQQQGVSLIVDGISSVGEASVASKLGLNAMKIDVQLLPNGDFQIGTEPTPAALKLHELLAALGHSSNRSIFVAVSNASSENTAFINQQISSLNEKFSTIVSLAEPGMKQAVLDLWSPKFASRVAELNKNQHKQPVMVRIKTRYTHTAPSPETAKP